MLPPAAAALAPDAILLRELLAVSLTGIIFYSPVYAPTGSGDIVDFTFEYLNPAAQRMMSMPEVPTLTHNQQWPHSIAHGTFQFHVDAFVTGEPREYNVNYQADGYDNYYRLAARRAGAGLLVSFTDPADQPRSPVEVALRESQALRRENGQITGVTVVATEVTEQVQARQQLEQLNQALEARVAARTQEADQARQRLDQVFRQAPFYLNVYRGPEHVFELVHPLTQALFGERVLLGRPRREALPELGEDSHQPFDLAYTTGETQHQPEMLTTIDRDGNGVLRKVYFDIVHQPLFDAQGQVEGVLTLSIDATERVHACRQAEALQAEALAAAQRQVQEREALFHILANTPSAVALLRGPEHHFEYVNTAYQQLFPDRPLTGRTVAEALPETEEAGFLKLLDEVYRTGETFFGQELLMRLVPPGGRPVQQVYYTFTYQAYCENNQITGVSIFAFDMTEQVLARQQREAERQQLRDLFEQAPVAIGILRGADYIVEVANPFAAQLWGRTPAELLGRPVFEALPEARDQGFKELLDGVRQSGEAFVAEGVPVQLLRGDTIQTVYLNYVYQPLRDADGTVTSVAAVGTDVTAQVRDRQRVQELNDQLAAINGQLEASNAELANSNTQLTRTNVDLDNFIYTASHDLKAPISNIEGLLYLLQEELPTAVVQDQTVGPILTRMLDAVERFKRTIGHLTEVSKLQKEHTPAADLVNLAAVVEDVRQDLLPLLQETGTRLVVDIATTPPVHFAAKNLRSIVYNLLSNAVKYRSPDRAPHVDVRAHVRAGHTVLEVHDNGLGLAPAQLPKLFGMFQRFHDHVDGTGIGLYMVKRMVENAGGRIDVHSQLSVGTTFFVHLPHTANLDAQPFLPFLPS